jgi:uncharacterized integral membrane protein
MAARRWKPSIGSDTHEVDTHEVAASLQPEAVGASEAQRTAPDGLPREGIPSTRAGRIWMRVLPSLVILAIVLVFVVQNRQDARISFFTASGRLPLAVALLGAFALGAAAVLLVGSIRILQLRKLMQRKRRAR